MSYCFDLFQKPLPVKNARLVRPLGDVPALEKKPSIYQRSIGRREAQKAERRQRVYNSLLEFARRDDHNQAASAIADASGVKLIYCQADLIELRDRYGYVKSTERVRFKGSWSQRLWCVAAVIERKVLPVGV